MKPAITDPNLGVLGDAELHIDADVAADIRQPRSPVIDGTIKVSGSMQAPAGTFGAVPAKGSEKETSSAGIQLSARVIDDIVALKVDDLSLSIPGTPERTGLADALSKQWYGITFDAIDAMMKAQSEKAGTPEQPKVRELLSRSFNRRISPPSVTKFVEKIHLWKGIELLPETDGLVRIRVESDKKKVLASVRAIREYLEENSGQGLGAKAWLGLNNQGQIDALLQDEATFMKSMGTVRGVLSADRTSYAFRGFDGDILDEKGVTQGHLNISLTSEGDFRLELTNTGTGEATVVEKSGAKFSVSYAGKELLSGLVSAEQFSMEAKDPESGAVVAQLKGNVQSATATNITLSDIEGSVPSKHIALKNGSYSMKVDTAKGGMLNTEISTEVVLGPAYEMKILISSERRTITSVSIEKPVYKPLEDLYQDLLAVLIGPGNAIQR